MIASKEYVMKMIQQEGLFPSKKFSQNFLIDYIIANDIVDLLNPNRYEKVIEIGPGLGSLSEFILNKGLYLTCYEIDKRMCEHLKKTFSHYDSFTLIEGDFLKQKFNNEDRVKVISNLPYSITTPIIEKVILDIKNCDTFVFMTQKEVSERLFAKVNTKEYSPLSILLNHVGVLKKEIVVKNNSFFPAPNVDSMVFSLRFNKDRDYEFDNKFYKFLKQCFLMRRKTLVNNLLANFNKEKLFETLNLMNLSQTIRPEQIKYEEYLKLFHFLTNQD